MSLTLRSIPLFSLYNPQYPRIAAIVPRIPAARRQYAVIGYVNELNNETY